MGIILKVRIEIFNAIQQRCTLLSTGRAFLFLSFFLSFPLFFILDLFIVFGVYGFFCLHICLCTLCVQVPQRPEVVTDPLELELQTIVSLRVDAGNRTQVFVEVSCLFSLYFFLIF